MKRGVAIFSTAFSLLLAGFSLSYAKAILRIICDLDGGKVYVDGKLKTKCYKDEPVQIVVPAGKHVVEVKKTIDEDVYYYFKRVVNVGDNVRVTITVKPWKEYTEEYYYKICIITAKKEFCEDYLRRYPNGKYVDKIKSKFKLER